MPGYVLSSDPNLSPAVSARVFGARWYKTRSATALTRLEDAVEKTFSPGVGASGGYSDFDDEPIYKDIKLCNVVNGQVTAYYGDAGFSRTPAGGDVMVEIPRYYYKIEETGTYRDYYISDQPLDGYHVSPRHAGHSGKGDGYEKIYVSAYTLNSSYRSVSGNASVVNISRATARTQCKARGTGYYQYDFATYWTIALLYIVEVADWNSQTAVGAGLTGGQSAQTNTGSTDNVTGHSGRANTNTTESMNGVKYRHMENLWGNIYQWCDGVNFSDATTYICLNPDQYADDVATNYSSLGYSKLTTNSQYITALGYDSNFPWAQICTTGGGTETTFIPDVYYCSTGWRALYLGGYWPLAGIAGLFCFGSSSAATHSNAYIGCRLLILP